MAGIQTVTGESDLENLLFCQCHEHLLMSKGQSYLVDKNLLIDDYEKSLQELTDYKRRGGTTIVEAQPVGCSRMAQGLFKLATESGVDIIASTGFHKAVFYPKGHWVFDEDTEWFEELFLKEIQEGMYSDGDFRRPERQTKVKAGIIKCAWDVPGLEGHYKKLFTAAVNVQKKTDVPFMVHIEPGSDPRALVAFLKKKEVDFSRYYFCHMDRACKDISVHKYVCEHGISLEYDTIGRFKYHDDTQEANIFCEMLDSGFEDQLLFSLDTTRARLKSYHAEAVGLCYILETFLPILRQRGVDEKILRKLYCYNPRRILGKR